MVVSLKYKNMNDLMWMKFMSIGSYLGCHQMPERSFYYNCYQFPVCARCTGVIVTSILALPLFFLCRIPIIIAIFMSSIMFFDWFLQYIKIKQSTNRRRLLTGLIGGLGWGTLHMYFYLFLLNSAKTILAKFI